MLNAKRVCVSAILFAACLVGMPGARAQSDQEQSVAEAARKAREQKKTPAKPATVITNDTLQPATPATVQNATAATESMPGTEAIAKSEATAAGSSTSDEAKKAQPAKGPSEAEIAQKKAKIEALKQEIADRAQEVDVQQRALALANESFYSRPDFSKDPDGKAKLDAMQSDVTLKQGQLAELKAKLKELAPDADQKPAAPQQ
jgi:anti-sigma28 factor (negative regulator of flagellin synthesis)